jgi:DNA helicase-2/ATP-dependent DNA helicase PcrA
MLSETSGSDKGVNLLTAHGSKGLEFEYVFLAGTNAASWEKKRKPGGGYTLPDTIFSSAKDEGGMEELRRLFYVAITRAEQFLSISYTRLKADGKETEASLFVAEICEDASLQPQPETVAREALTEFGTGFFNRAATPEIEKMEADFIDQALEKFVMNVTALNNYLNCPLEFYFRNLVRVPTGKSEAAEFGSSVHFALQRLFEKMRDNNQVFPPQADFIADFEWFMRRHRESFTREQFDRRMEYGREILAAYYTKYINSFNKIVAVERTIRNVAVNGVPLKGKLDKLEFDGKLVNVVDYKTGDIEKARIKLKPPGEKNPNGGDYWRQAVFYKILIDHYEQRGWKAVSTEFDFIEPDKKKIHQREKLVITPDDTDIVTAQITDVWNKIQQRDFYTGCGKEDCRWCNFAKDYQLAIHLHNNGEEVE